MFLVNGWRSIFQHISVGGDFKIYMLNPNKHRMRDEFISMIFSIGLYPHVIKPSRLTTHSATLNDNIFPNGIEKKIVSGLMIIDISDHLPVLAVFKYNSRKNKMENKHWFRRVKTEESVEVLKKVLKVLKKVLLQKNYSKQDLEYNI